MLDAIKAEALKLRRHRGTWLMVWVYPIVFGLIILSAIVRDLVYGAGPGMPTSGANVWVVQSTLIWGAPLSAFGRFLIAAFAALAFAGEYSWNTWKLIIPARSRWQLIVAKWMTAFAFVFAAFVAADVVNLLGSLVRAGIGGPAIPPGVTVAAVANAHLSAAAHAIVPIIYTLALAGLIAVLTTSVLATVIISIGIIVVEQLLLPVGGLGYSYAPLLTWVLIKTLPFYHVANLLAWARGGGLNLPIGADALVAATWSTSLAIVVSWIAGIGAATIARFTRQDLN